MKNFLKIGLFLTLAFIIASCENPTNEKPTLIDTTLEAITIKTNPTKTTYQINEEFDPTGLVITATYTETYSNASTKTTTKDVTYNNGNMTFSGTDFSTAGTKTITVTYSEKGTTKTATLQVTVNQDEGNENNKVITYSYTNKIDLDMTPVEEAIAHYKLEAEKLLTDSTSTDLTINIPSSENEVDIQLLYELYNKATTQGQKVFLDFETPENTTIINYLQISYGIDTTKDKDADKYSNIKNFIELITPESQESPKLSAYLVSGIANGVNEVNLYHTGIDKLLKKSCDLGRSDDIGFIGEIAYFDAVDHLTEKGGIAYNEDGSYANNYYDLDVNTALLMGVPVLKNVNITGSISGDRNTFEGELTNVRFAENTSGFTFSDTAHGVGLIEFAGDAPAVLPVTDKARLVISNADNENTIILEGDAVIDLTQLPDDGNVSFYNSGNVAYEHAYFKNEEAKQNYIQNGFGNNGTTYSLENGTSSIPYYATSQQWVDAANANDGEGNFVKTDCGVYMPNVSNLQ